MKENFPNFQLHSQRRSCERQNFSFMKFLDKNEMHTLECVSGKQKRDPSPVKSQDNSRKKRGTSIKMA